MARRALNRPRRGLLRFGWGKDGALQARARPRDIRLSITTRPLRVPLGSRLSDPVFSSQILHHRSRRAFSLASAVIDVHDGCRQTLRLWSSQPLPIVLRPPEQSCLDLPTPGAPVGLQPVEAVGEVCRGSVLEDGYGGECRTLGQLIGVFVDDRFLDDCARLRSRVDRDLFDRKALLRALCVRLSFLCPLLLGALAVVLVDLDPQGSASAWSDLREADTPVVASAHARRLAQILAAAATAGTERAVLDTPGHTADTALLAARAADLVLIPCHPATADLHAIGTTIDIARLANRPAAVVINEALVNHRVNKEAEAAIQQYDVMACPVILHQRIDHQHAFTEGLTAAEFAPKGQAAEEIRELEKWIERVQSQNA